TMHAASNGGFLFGGLYSYSGSNQRYVARVNASGIGVTMAGANGLTSDTYAQAETSGGATYVVPTSSGGHVVAFSFEQYPYNPNTGDDIYFRRVENSASIGWQTLLAGNSTEEPTALLPA